ncbi:nad -binding rossmann-like domain protein [Leptolyngbya sp. Heron Island J]|uniref:phytoene desaturase family protein n=1 Tax=Leptolyngbya sp. Heron Island J TaxID=1385935 RepID=UPI0003B9BC7F|nr:NAD(P)/FAD-dependent oxidoreductase [Leptolyngbya sp. Heron Island J]ESA32522.1 nad -binding rossmann-like domain protein [Leptolyngbya sp. Heron Island J]
MKTQRKDYDLILIGSGIGALTVASLMAQLRNKRVLILERHFVAGGFTHTFQRKGFHWDPGLHYVGQMEAGSSVRHLFDLVTNQQVLWQKMPEPFEKFVYPGLSFDLYGDPQRFQADLIERFPDESQAIRQYFKDLSKAAAALFLDAARNNSAFLFKVVGAVAKLWHGTSLDLTTQDYLDQHFQSPELKALLVSQWLDHGLPPADSPFALHATIVSHYLDGGYYSVGGSGTIAKSVQQVVEAKGGQVLVSREVTEILLDDGQAAGVRVRNLQAKEETFEDYYAPVVVSNAGAYNTYLKFIPDSYPIPFRESLQQFVDTHPPTTGVSVFIGFKDDPRQLGFKGENHWIYNTFDHQDVERQKSRWVYAGKPLQIYLSFPSLKNPHAKKHTAELNVAADYNSFVFWRDQAWLHRDKDYSALKQRIQNVLLEMVEEHYPGFSDLVDYCEVSTPLTNEHFTAHPKGGIYGLPMYAERFAAKNRGWTKIKTPVPGLYMTGSDVYVMGIVGAMMGAVLTTSHLPDGVSIPQVFSTAAKAQDSGKQDLSKSSHAVRLAG